MKLKVHNLRLPLTDSEKLLNEARCARWTHEHVEVGDLKIDSYKAQLSEGRLLTVSRTESPSVDPRHPGDPTVVYVGLLGSPRSKLSVLSPACASAAVVAAQDFLLATKKEDHATLPT